MWISENWVFPLFTEFFENFVASLLKIQWDFQKSVSFYRILKEYPAEKGPGNSLKVLENRGKLIFFDFSVSFFKKVPWVFWILITEFFRKWWKNKPAGFLPLCSADKEKLKPFHFETSTIRQKNLILTSRLEWNTTNNPSHLLQPPSYPCFPAISSTSNPYLLLMGLVWTESWLIPKLARNSNTWGGIGDWQALVVSHLPWRSDFVFAEAHRKALGNVAATPTPCDAPGWLHWLWHPPCV